MMEALIRRGEELARAAQRAKIVAVAEQLQSQLSDAAVDVAETGVLVRGRAIGKRWLTDPALRFLK